MKNILYDIITQIVDHPESVVIDEATVQGKIILTVHVHTEDMGKIIGKKGRIIRALRDIIKIVATKERMFVDITLAEN